MVWVCELWGWGRGWGRGRGSGGEAWYGGDIWLVRQVGLCDQCLALGYVILTGSGVLFVAHFALHDMVHAILDTVM